MNLKRNLIVVDVEADGPCPGQYSMVCFGAVSVNRLIDPHFEHDAGHRSFYGETAPLTEADIWTGGSGYRYLKHDPVALEVSGFSREQHEKFPHALSTMVEFKSWLSQFDRPAFVSDNPAFDWQWINFYFHLFGLGNPFGFSARRIGDFAAGLDKNWDDANSWKKLRKTSHTHNPVDDAMGNAEALIKLLGRATNYGN